MYGSSAAAQQSVERWNRSAPEEAAGAAKGSRRVKRVSSIIARTGAGDGERSRSGDPVPAHRLGAGRDPDERL